ncbi:MAG: hypothetical protein R3C97_01145 [Geminicoccaceae bacterium]
MNYDTVPAAEFGRSLKGIGLNLLTADVEALARLMAEAFGAKIHRLSKDFAIIEHGPTLLQLHHDATYGSHPLLGLLPENPPRGAGIQLYFFGVDPARALPRAEALGAHIIEQPRDKPHGLHEGTVLSAEGYALTAARPIAGS